MDLSDICFCISFGWTSQTTWLLVCDVIYYRDSYEGCG